MNHDTCFEENRYFSWLVTLLDADRFDVVVSVERKATAMLRALLDLSPNHVHRWDWSRVLSSDALRYLPADWLKGKRILVFNEMIHHGHSTQDTIRAIEDNTPGARRFVWTAAFVVHEEFRSQGPWRTQDFREEPDAPSPDFAILRSASSNLYRVLRERLVACLRRKGALLLDTEHVESTFTLNLPLRRFIDSLAGFGDPVEYEDDSRVFPGITVRAPVVVDASALAARLPKDTRLETRAPRKVRVVRRGSSQFAFIPIWYPPVPATDAEHSETWPTCPSYLLPQLAACPRGTRAELTFHLASLVTAVELTRTIWAGLRPLVNKGLLPDTLGGSVVAASPLGHLRALYPLLEFGHLEREIDVAISGYRDKVTSGKVQSVATKQRPDNGDEIPVVVRREKLTEESRRLLVAMVRRQRRYSIDADWFDYDVPNDPFSWDEFREVGNALEIPDSLRSIVMDAAIDDAILKTTHKIVEIDGRPYVVRAYEPDSEFAQEELERMAHGAEEVIACE